MTASPDKNRRFAVRGVFGLPALGMLAVLLGGAAVAALLGGCTGSNELPAEWGSLQPQQDTPENFDLAWDAFDQVLSCKLLRNRDPNATSGGLVEDPTALGEAPKEMVYAPSISLLHARHRVIECLNNWIGGGDLQQGAVWQRDALIDKLPAYLHDNRLEQVLGLKSLDELSFRPEDFDYLQQCIWMRDISRWGLDSEPGPLTRDMIRRIEEDLEPAEAERLVSALKLFDWTTRNVQLDPLLPQPKDITAGPGGDQRPVSAAQRGEAGPGYTLHAWQVLLYGHGDAWQRSRVFIQLARQAGIDAVMLAAEDTGPAGRHEPLFAAALVGGKLYLFDAELGLPIPGPDNRPIAALADVQSAPELLRKLDVEETGQTLKYRHGAEDVKSIVALIDADPPALSLRMRLAEQNLSGNDKQVLTVSPVAIASRVQKCPGVKTARIWTVPMDTWIYRTLLPYLAKERPDVMATLAFEEQIFGDVSSPPCMGRYCHLHGRFEKQGDDPPASKWYLDARAPNDFIRQLEVQAELQRKSTEDLTEEEREQRVANIDAAVQRLQTVKSLTTTWLGQTKYETRDFGTSRNWLKRVDMTDDNPWRATARYNLARAHEARGDIDAARRLYLIDDSPQRQGNRIRARLLRRLQAEAQPKS